MRLRGSSSWAPLTIHVRLARRFGVQRAADHGPQHRQHAIPDTDTTLVCGMGAERDRGTSRVDVLPPARMGQTELLSGGSGAVGGAGAGEPGQELGVLAGEAPPVLLQCRDLVACPG